MFSLIMCFSAQPGLSQEITTEVVGEAHARGWVVLRAVFPARGKVVYASLGMRGDDGQQQPISAGLGHHGELPRFVSADAQRTVIDIFVVQDAKEPCDRAAFDSPGRYHLRWHIRFEEPTGELEIDQIVDVAAVTKPDACFLDRASDLRLMARLLGRDPLESFSPEVREAVLRPENADCRAFLFIEAIREFMGSDPRTLVKSLPRELDRRLWADTLFEVFEECPESSYAPYAACVAGTFYVAEIEEANRRDHQSRIALQARQSDDYRRALRALNFATANRYLAGNAYFKLAVLACFGADWESMESAFVSMEALPWDEEARKETASLRRSLQAARDKYEREHGER